MTSKSSTNGRINGRWHLILTLLSRQLRFFFLVKKERNLPELTFNGASVTRVKEHKHLGLILEPNLSFEKHLYEKMVKAKNTIHPPLGTSLNYLMEKVERMKYQAALAATGSSVKRAYLRHFFVDPEIHQP